MPDRTSDEDPRQPLSHTDINWTLEPLDRLEKLDLRAFNADQLLDYTFELRRECQMLRELMHESLGALAMSRQQLDRALRIVRITMPRRSGQ